MNISIKHALFAATALTATASTVSYLWDKRKAKKETADLGNKAKAKSEAKAKKEENKTFSFELTAVARNGKEVQTKKRAIKATKIDGEVHIKFNDATTIGTFPILEKVEGDDLDYMKKFGELVDSHVNTLKNYVEEFPEFAKFDKYSDSAEAQYKNGLTLEVEIKLIK